jgi:hypothetical protein
MRTKLTISAIVLGCAIAGLGLMAFLMIWLGAALGVALALGLAAATVLTYVRWIGPRFGRWGASDAELARAMPGDELFPGAPCATRAISIDAPPKDVWPWLLQIGYGRAGWYSYDWIDNDGKPSANRIVPELQDVKPGDNILMIPGLGFTVRALEPQSFMLMNSGDSGTWCIELVPQKDGETRLISRWRDSWRSKVNPANFFWIAVSDPGSFIMEREMLRGIKKRAESRQRSLVSMPVTG